MSDPVKNCANCRRPIRQHKLGRMRLWCDDYCKHQGFVKRQEERRLAAQLQVVSDA